MLPSRNKPPQDVVDLMKEFFDHQDTRELYIFDTLFMLYEKTITKGEDGIEHVAVGPFIRRAMWQDATGLTPEQIKSALGIH